MLEHKNMTQDLPPEQADAMLTKITVPLLAEMQRSHEADPNARRNYVTGAILPILILGTCAFITAGEKR